MKKLIQSLITKKAQKLIAQHKPLIVAVTGSVGKTSVRNAIATILSAKFRVGETIKNYNNEFGVPLSILGFASPGKSIFGWLKILMSKPREVPQVFVLEYGIDHPDDMSHLCDIATPKISVLTRLSPVHAEFFPSVAALAEEKAVLLARTAPDGLCVLNADDALVMGTSHHAAAPVVTYGFSDTAQMRASNYSLTTRDDFSFEPGETFSTVKVDVTAPDHDALNLELVNILGKANVSVFLPAIAIAKHLGLSHEEILSKIPEVVLEPGRMNPIPGIKGSLILDASYNAAPASMAAALEVLSSFTHHEGTRRIAVLGHMAELGPLSESEHRMLGMRAAEAGVDVLVTVGELSLHTQRGAMEAGIPQDHTQHFSQAKDAGRWLDSQIKKGDIVLVKGSQSARMERVVKDVMAEPLRATELLVRQEAPWQE
ncbi:UDP-N-acetylmuramoyl-tripeptide--D-alanyl-D-alanine ligase [Candidatus Uhrbacteria bacterium]|nr:UDP-N-acetylmuramoyl-tripeptide--D-alanyl-D-alanine ligase [Candidatus Uhrbacteria bacterium]